MIKIKDLLERTVDNRGKTPPTSETGHVLMEINCITGNQKYPDYTMIKKYVSNETYETWFRSGHPQKGDILIPTVGTLNAIGLADRDDCCIAQNMIAFRTNPRICEGEFLYYLLCNPIVRKKLLQLDIGAVQPSIKVPHIKNFEIILPDLDKQRKIAGILAALDDKIALNQQINKNLEEQAQAIFAEFLANHELSSVTVEDVILTANTGADAIQKAPIVAYDTGVRCVRVGDMSNQRPVHEWGFTQVTPEIFKQYQLHKDDIVITRTASLGLNRLIGKDLNAVYNNGLIRITVNQDIIYPLILFCQFQTDDYRNYISRINSETSVRPNMKINYLLKYEFDIPHISEQVKLKNIGSTPKVVEMVL